MRTHQPDKDGLQLGSNNLQSGDQGEMNPVWVGRGAISRRRQGETLALKRSESLGRYLRYLTYIRYIHTVSKLAKVLNYLTSLDISVVYAEEDVDTAQRPASKRVLFWIGFGFWLHNQISKSA